MRKRIFIAIATLLAPAAIYAVDGQVDINQTTVNTAGGFPYKITAPGSYKLSGSLTAPANVDAIDINSDNVTLDLNGFTITCSKPFLSLFTGTGVGVNSTGSSVTVKNGSVTSCAAGVSMNGPSNLVEDVHADNNNNGIVGGGIVFRCTANSNHSNGMIVDHGSIFNSTAISNGVFGIFLSNGLAGSNTILNNFTADLSGGTSQGNNSCTGGSC